MIKVIEGLKVKPGANIQQIFRKLRRNAMRYPGFISAENLISLEEPFVSLFVSTWNELPNWEAWEISGARAELYREAKELIEDEPKASKFRIVPTYW